MVNPNDIYCIIMAGGVGSRFWPLSRSNNPKQFLDILGTGNSLLRETFLRVSKFCKVENIYIVTGKEYKQQVQEHIPELDTSQVLLEPMRRNTAPCIAFASHKIKKINPNAVIVVAPSDHLILNQEEFVNTIKTSIEFAYKNNALLTIGIKPNRPETGYGYIQTCKQADKTIPNLYKVKTFTEKPNLEMAKVFIESGEFYWNSGIFIWSVSAIDKAFQKYLPDLQNLFTGVKNQLETENENTAIEDVYSQCSNISIDYGILEKADNVYVICSEFGWSDLGTWGSLYQHHPKDNDGNAINANNVMVYNTKNSIVNVPKDKLVILQGLENYIIAESDNILLICSQKEEQQIKNFLNDVLLEKGDEFL